MTSAKTYILSQPHSFIDYILEPLKDNPDYIIRTHRHCRSLGAKIKRFIRSILPGSHPGLWSDSILSPEYTAFLRQIRPQDKLIFWAVGNKKDIKIISEDVTTSRISSLLLDPLRQVCHFSEKEIRMYPGFMRKLGVRVCTFDYDDSRKYGLDFVGQVYRYPDISRSVGNDTEVLFIGVDKKRAPKLDAVAATLEKEGIPYNFMLLYDKHSKPGRFPRLDKCVMKESIPYQDVLRKSSRAKCLLDILQPGQSGMTMRVLEALFLGKKLITDNISAKQEPLYRKENIYIIGDPEQPWDNIRRFLDEPFLPLSKGVYDIYDISSWIKKLS